LYIKTNLRFQSGQQSSRKQANVREDVGEKESLYTVGRNEMSLVIMEISMEVPQITENRNTV
jgi:hypothetical protein